MNFFHVKRSSKRGGQINPLLLPSIVHRTVRYLNFKELLACRHINKLWREEASKQLLQQDSVIVVLPDWQSIEQFARVAAIHKKAYPMENIFTALRLCGEVNLAEKSNQFAVDKISFQMKHLELYLSTGPLEWRWLLFDQFVNLKELHFHGSVPFQPIIVTPNPETGSVSPTPSTSSKQHSFHHGRAKELVNLVKVVFNIKNRKAEDIFVRRFLRDMFSLIPNLQSLEWIKDDRFANEFQKTMFDCLMIKTKIGNMGHLEIFKCPSLTCGARELKEIGDRAFPLKELHIQISSEVSAQFLENFLESHGETLEIVKLDFSPGSPLNVMVSSPVSGLANLKELSLMEYRRSIGFVGYLPCLKKLYLTRTNIKRALLSIGWAFDYKEQKELSKSLTELYVYNDYLSREHGNCTREIVLKLAHCFPNLKAIRLEGLDDSSIRHLLKSFNNLEELYAPSGTYSDEAFRSYTCKDQLMNMGGSRSPSRSPSRYTLSSFDASHLKNLRTLELESIGLTDRFVTQGIINWRSIRNLSIKYCRMSYTVLARMMMEMDLHQLRLHQCTIHTQGIFGLSDDPVDMTQDDDVLNLSQYMIHKWRFDSFRLLFIHTEP